MSVSPATSSSATTAESVSTGATGGAALGSVIALGFAAGSVLVPFIGGAAGAAGGALLGYLVRRHQAAKSSSPDLAKPITSRSSTGA